MQLNRWLTPAVRETKSELAIHTVSPDDGFRGLLRALERNELVALMVDGDVFRHGVAVEPATSGGKVTLQKFEGSGGSEVVASA